MIKNESSRIQINDCIMMDVTFFREMNSNYSRFKIDIVDEIRTDPSQQMINSFEDIVIT